MEKFPHFTSSHRRCSKRKRRSLGADMQQENEVGYLITPSPSSVACTFINFTRDPKCHRGIFDYISLDSSFVYNWQRSESADADCNQNFSSCRKSIRIIQITRDFYMTLISKWTIFC